MDINQCCPHIETSQLTCNANQLTGLIWSNGLIWSDFHTETYQ